MTNTYDAVVVGGGPAGLQATLTLARVHRKVLMIDSGHYRNDPARHMHNVVTHDGAQPAEFRAAARKELAAYDTVTVRDDAATSIAPTEGAGFEVALEAERVATRGVVLATGVVDTLPGTPGLSELFGSVVAHCPFCHGHEFAGGHVGILGTSGAGHLPGLVGPIASRVSVFTDGEELTEELPAGVAVRTARVTGVYPTAARRAEPSGLTTERARQSSTATVCFADGSPEEVAGLFVRTTFAQRAVRRAARAPAEPVRLRGGRRLRPDVPARCARRRRHGTPRDPSDADAVRGGSRRIWPGRRCVPRGVRPLAVLVPRLLLPGHRVRATRPADVLAELDRPAADAGVLEPVPGLARQVVRQLDE
jgi:thioredoxin reductase